VHLTVLAGDEFDVNGQRVHWPDLADALDVALAQAPSARPAGRPLVVLFVREPWATRMDRIERLLWCCVDRGAGSVVPAGTFQAIAPPLGPTCVPPVRITLSAAPVRGLLPSGVRIASADLGRQFAGPAEVTKSLREQIERFGPRWAAYTPVVIDADGTVCYEDWLAVYRATLAAGMRKVGLPERYWRRGRQPGRRPREG
jgi:hypothetical protein